MPSPASRRGQERSLASATPAHSPVVATSFRARWSPRIPGVCPRWCVPRLTAPLRVIPRAYSAIRSSAYRARAGAFARSARGRLLLSDPDPEPRSALRGSRPSAWGRCARLDDVSSAPGAPSPAGACPAERNKRRNTPPPAAARSWSSRAAPIGRYSQCWCRIAWSRVVQRGAEHVSKLWESAASDRYQRPRPAIGATD